MNKIFVRLLCAVMLFGFSSAIVSCTPDSGDEGGAGVSLNLTQVASSSHSVTLAWSDGSAAGSFNVKLYRDAACTEEFQSYALRMASPYRFTFPYLTPSTSYYAVVELPSGVCTAPVEVRSADEQVYFERKVLYQDFDALCWGGDYVNSANCVVLSGKTPSTLTDVVTLEDIVKYSKATTSPNDDEGPKLTLCPKSILTLFGLESWMTNNAYIRPGYVKLGSASSKTEDYIMTPSIDKLPDEAGIKVAFKAMPFSSSGKGASGTLKVRLVSAANEVKKEREVTYNEGHDWTNVSISFDGVVNGDKLYLCVNAGEQVCIDELLVQATVDVATDAICGFVRYTNGSPIAGVAVSDGFSVVATDADGYYELKPSSDTWYIFISLPSGCKVPVGANGSPGYYKRFDPSIGRYDFTLEPLENGPEKEFVLFCLGDPQVRSQETVDRFYYETRKQLREHAKQLAAEGLQAYGITLGDNVSSSSSKDCSTFMETIRNHMSDSRIGFPLFQVMGNHDFKGAVEVSTDATSSTYELKAQRTFESCFGPVNFSFNRGDVHIIGMRDIIYNFEKNGLKQYAAYSRGFTNAQYEWLKQDLALVPKDKMVVLCVHIPLHSCSGTNVNNVFKLLSQFARAHVMAGHTHDMNNSTVSGYPAIEEHTLGATCGCWWRSNLCKDGAPNGYGVFHADGATFKNWYYQGVNEGLNDKGYQMRLFRGGMVAGGQYEYIKSSYPNSTLLAHVFNRDDRWTVKVYCSGQLLGEMTKIRYTQGDPYGVESYNEYVTAHGTPSLSNPTVLKANASNDWYANGYHVGVMKGRTYFNPSYHMYKFEGLTDEQMQTVEVVATDRFGNEYRSSDIIQGTVGKDFTYQIITAPTH